MKKFQKQYPKDLEEAEKQLYYENGRTNKPLNSIPCLICDGLGWFYDPSEKPCSVEGYKMVTRIKCKDCNEKGYTINDEMAKKSYFDSIAKNIDRDNKEEIKYNKKLERFIELKNTLTEEDFKIIREFA